MGDDSPISWDFAFHAACHQMKAGCLGRGRLIVSLSSIVIRQIHQEGDELVFKNNLWLLKTSPFLKEQLIIKRVITKQIKDQAKVNK